MKLTDFDFELPEDLIAVRPAVPRSASRLLVAENAALSDNVFTDLPNFLRKGDRLVLNNTKVIPARLKGTRTKQSEQGEVTANIEVTLLGPTNAGTWQALVKPLRKLAEGQVIEFSTGFSARCIRKGERDVDLEFSLSGKALDQAIENSGFMPLPPYIASKRAADERDKSDYQTVWASQMGAVAAPTASLHFDDGVLNALKEKGVEISFVTLHVGAGTFLPVSVDNIATHKMHAERGSVSEQAAAEINETRKNGGRIIAVGTTALRLIETASQKKHISAWEGATDIFIYPGYSFQVTDGLITNFHLPKSTLLMLVSALMGKDFMDQIYTHAIAQKYRFFSYGDASLLLP